MKINRLRPELIPFIGALLVSLAAWGCGDDPGAIDSDAAVETDGGGPDASDAAQLDSGSEDAGGSDADTADASGSDAEMADAGDGAVDPNPSGRLTYTMGTSMALSPRDPAGTLVSPVVGQHKCEVLCAVSHFSYDDPIRFSGESGRSPLKMFFGNTEASALSTGESIPSSGNNSCTSGVSNRGAYWTPAVLNAAGEAVVPNAILVHYRSFITPDQPLNAIPSGLKMVSRPEVLGYSETPPRLSGGEVDRIGERLGQLRLHIEFPNCLAVNGSDEPILESADGVSHLAYATPSSGSTPWTSIVPEGAPPTVACPASHPYAIPTLFVLVNYDEVDPDSAWQLSSDSGTKGASLDAGYIAHWGASDMQTLIAEISARKITCQFPSNFSDDQFSLGPDGDRVYQSALLTPDADRTPFGVLPSTQNN